MLEILRRIVQEVNAARNLEQALGIIVNQVKQAMEVDVCSVYLLDPSKQLVLMATEGLNREAVGRVRLSLDRGLIGLVAERAEPINLDEAPSHPRFQYFPETGEERYHSFLGVPIIHHRKGLGVLAVQRIERQCFEEESVSFLMTVAAQLAGAIAHAEASGGLNGLQTPRYDRTPLNGVPGAPGVGIGTAVVVYPRADLDAIPDRQVTDIAREEAVLREAFAAVRIDIESLLERLREMGLPAEDRALFEAYLLMLDSESLMGRALEYVRAGNWASGALRATVDESVRVFAEMDDPYLSERASDVRDLGIRLLSYLQRGPRQHPNYPKRTILIGEEVTASILAEVPPKRLAGVVSVRGSSNSHVAILARAMGIPAVMGAGELPVGRIDGCEIVIDGYQGRVYVSPTDEVRNEYKRLAREEAQLSAELDELRELPAETPDGRRIPLYANSGLISELNPTGKSGAEGIGLYRTEFPFLVRDGFPSEEEQYKIYRQILKTVAPKPVVLRTLDVGGDKALHYFPIVEDNPFLGWRGIRITLDHPEIFLVQLRAMLRADVGLQNLQILLPMISNLAEVDEALRLLRQASTELQEEGHSVHMPPVGVMIEVPSAVYQADALARRVDFLSIGTNDLTQYLLAVDRNNARVAHLYDSFHPAVLQAIQQVVRAAHAHGRKVSVCGEMAGEPTAAVILLGMGIDALSMNASSLQRVKWGIRSFTQAQARALLDEVLALESAGEVRAHLSQALERAGLGGLVRAGR